MTVRAARAVLILWASLLSASTAATENPRVVMHTTLGEIVIELFAKEAPASTENFLRYVEEGFYDGTIFHRVIGNFMIQGGGFTPQMKQKRARDPIVNESDNRLSNMRGTIAMARTPDPHSGTSQFFINVVDNHGLDFGAQGAQGWGYAVFGKVVAGMEVVDRIRSVRTGPVGGYRDVPLTPVVIETANLEPPGE